MSRSILRHPLMLILLLAAALRIAVTIGASAHHPDEIFQYLEQAHRIVFGYGIVPWEYRAGMRSWLVPLALAGPMKLGTAIAPDSALYVILPRLAVALGTLGIVWAAWALGQAIGRVQAIVAAVVAGLWFEQIFYASHTLSETIATSFALPGLALLVLGTRRQLAAAGMCLALAAVVRFHYAPALAVAVLWQCRLHWRARWMPLILGAVPALALSGAVDLGAGQWPFQWIVENVRQNVINDAASNYGVSDAGYYFRGLRAWWRWATLPLLVLALLGGRRYPVLLAVAVVTIATHMTIGHKEERFILLAVTLLVILAAIGTADAITILARREQVRPLVAGALTLWAVASLVLATTGPMRLRWALEAPALAAARIAGQSAACGVATWRMRYWQSGGYSFVHRNVPIYPLSASDELYTPVVDRTGLPALAPGFDTIITTAEGVADIPPGYRRIACRTMPGAIASEAERTAMAICVYRREGRCEPSVTSPWKLN